MLSQLAFFPLKMMPFNSKITVGMLTLLLDTKFSLIQHNYDQLAKALKTLIN